MLWGLRKDSAWREAGLHAVVHGRKRLQYRFRKPFTSCDNESQLDVTAFVTTMISIVRSIAAACVLGILLPLWASHCQAETDAGEVQIIWRLLDYIAVDYAGAVTDGVVSNPVEYAEQEEFAATAATRLDELPPNPQKEALQTAARRLQQAIHELGTPTLVADIAHALGAALLQAYPVPLGPETLPDMARGRQLYSEHCAGCHGSEGHGDGPAATALDIPPTAFTEVERARQRSLFALYQVITQGLDDTPMRSFAELSSGDRWALAFVSGALAFDGRQAARGEVLWQGDDAVRAQLSDLDALVALTPASLGERFGTEKADAVMAYLRRHPESLLPQGPGLLVLAREHLAQSLAAYEAGKPREATRLALSAYLDGFEPIEPLLATRNGALLAQVETGMGAYRAAIQRGEGNDELRRRAELLNTLFDDVEAALTVDAASSITTFIGAATILLREGLEALLIIVAMIAFLQKAGRQEAMPYLHGGWIGALLAGFATWVVATWFIGISGASRELTEGAGSLFAAVVLLSVGIWMHGKAQADQWQRYISTKMSKALSGRSAWLLFGLAFLVVYREVFETILFYAALWAQGNGLAMFLGAATAGVVLALIAWAMLRYSRRLRIDRFFTYSSWLIAVLTVVLAGKGIAALQEAGIVNIAPLAFLPRLSLIGLYPTVQTVVAQVLMIVALLVGFAWNRQQAAKL